MTNYDPIETVKAAVADKEKLCVALLQHLEETQRAIAGLTQAAPTVLSNDSEFNTRKMLNTTMNLVKRQQELNQLVMSVIIMLISSSDFIGWQAHLAVKLGADGKEVLAEMLRQKLRR